MQPESDCLDNSAEKPLPSKVNIYNRPARILRRPAGIILTSRFESPKYVDDCRKTSDTRGKIQRRGKNQELLITTDVHHRETGSRGKNQELLITADVHHRETGSCGKNQELLITADVHQRETGSRGKNQELLITADVHHRETGSRENDLSNEIVPRDINEAVEGNVNPDVSSDCSTSDGYDTDLDRDTTVAELFHRNVDPVQDKSADVVRLQDYKRECCKRKAVPQTAVLRHLGDNELNLCHRNIGSHHLKPVLSALKDNMRIKRLLLKDVGMDKDGAASLSDCLLENVSISYLDVSGNSLGYDGVAQVARLLLSNTHISGLDLSDSKIGTNSIPLLSYLLQMNNSLRFLDLSKNRLEDRGLRILAAAIGENSGLAFLRLSWNCIRLSGAAAIGQSLLVNNGLRILDLSWNGMAYEGAVALAEGLKENSILQELNLSHNNINWNGALVLSRALKKNSTLKTLRLGGNPLTTTGAMDLVQAAGSRESGLRLLDLENVPVVLETELLAIALGELRDFRLIHGGVVFIHDVIGRRLERYRDPMERLMEHLREHMIRPLEMLRSFDKNVEGKVSQKEFIYRIQQSNVPLHPFERRALAASLAEVGAEGTDEINYGKLMRSVERHVLQDRTRKWEDQLRRQRVRDYNTRILSDGKPMFTKAYSFSLGTAPPLLKPLNVSQSSMSTERTEKTRESMVSDFAELTMTSTVGGILKKSTKAALGFKLSTPLDEVGLRKKKTTRRKDKKKTKQERASRKEMSTLIGALRV